MKRFSPKHKPVQQPGSRAISKDLAEDHQPIQPAVVARKQALANQRRFGAPGPDATEIPSTGEFRPGPTWAGTVLMLAILCITRFLLAGEQPVAIARFAAIGTLVGLAGSLVCDIKLGGGPRNLIRADLFSIFSLYYLTFVEFLLPQYQLNYTVSVDSVRGAVTACLIAFAGLAIGRHLTRFSATPITSICQRPISRFWMLALFWGAFATGFLYMLASVDFDPVEMVQNFIEARGDQPWARGSLGDWRALLTELRMGLFLVPPLAGVMLARRRNYTRFQLVSLALGLLFTLFYGFSGGTRHVLSAYLITFLIAYCFALPRGRIIEVAIVSVACLAFLWVSTTFMLRFREIGLRNYFEGDYQPHQGGYDYFFVDYNLRTISRLKETFPEAHAYLGWEVPYLAIIRPFPRAIWRGKPERLSLSIENIMGADEETGATVLSTFVGEGHVSRPTRGVPVRGAVRHRGRMVEPHCLGAQHGVRHLDLLIGVFRGCDRDAVNDGIHHGDPPNAVRNHLWSHLFETAGDFCRKVRWPYQKTSSVR